MKKFCLILVLFSLPLWLSGCGAGVPGVDRPLRVATTSGPHAEILYAASEMAIEAGLAIDILEYADNLKANDLLVRGEVDANCFQPEPYFENLVADRQWPLVAVARTVIFPVALYSQKISRLADLPIGATVAIPNDPSGEARALLLLEKTGIITLRQGVGAKAAVIDIVANPRNIRLRQLDADLLPRRLGEFDLAAINSTFAAAAGLIPDRDALASEGADSPFAHIIAVQAKDKDSPAVATLVKAYRSDHVKNYIHRRFQGTVITSW
jgi:D-methionine transport system substrate-binding protein